MCTTFIKGRWAQNGIYRWTDPGFYGSHEGLEAQCTKAANCILNLRGANRIHMNTYDHYEDSINGIDNILNGDSIQY